jgi:polysaccharide pyruvyl transferase WcaK-like protein
MRRIAHFGTFDVENYGDLLFPLLAEVALPDFEVVHVSPIGGKPPFSDSAPTQTLRTASRQRFDGVLVGGGNIVRGGSRVVADYAPVRFSAYPGLWAGAAALAERQQVPLVVNAAGVSAFHGLSRLGRAALGRADYLAVRDAGSRQRLLDLGVTVPISVVADTAIRLPDLWSAPDLAETRSEIVGDEPVVAFHVNSRYVTTAKDTAGDLDRIASALSLRPVLLAIGRCHGDHRLIAEIAPHMSSKPLLLERPASLREIAAVIAAAGAYVGSSMHGMITACAYRRPGILVVRDNPLHKFGGFLEHVSAPERMVASWSAISGHERGLRTAVDPQAAQDQVRRHWQQVVTTLSTGSGDRRFDPLTRSWKPIVEIHGRGTELLRRVAALRGRPTSA